MSFDNRRSLLIILGSAFVFYTDANCDARDRVATNMERNMSIM